MKYIFTFYGGIFLALALFVTFKFTPRVTSTDVERAVSVCKEGKWVVINNVDIICEDGAVYPRISKS